MNLTVFEVFEVRARGAGEVVASVSVDCPTEERAYRVAVRFDAIDESFEQVEVRAWWGNDLVEHKADASPALRCAITRALECDDDLTSALCAAACAYREDVAVYDRVADEGRV